MIETAADTTPSSSSSRGPEDFPAFYAEHAERVLLYLARRCLDPEIAVDLMAETFAQAYVGRGRFRGRTDEEAAAWVFGIARNQLASWFRRGKAERKAIERLGLSLPSAGEDDLARIERLAGLGEIREAVRSGFERLSGEQREALTLRVLDEMSYAEVADRLQISEQSARARVSRGLRKLAGSLGGQTTNEGTVTDG